MLARGGIVGFLSVLETERYDLLDADHRPVDVGEVQIGHGIASHFPKSRKHDRVARVPEVCPSVGQKILHLSPVDRLIGHPRVAGERLLECFALCRRAVVVFFEGGICAGEGAAFTDAARRYDCDKTDQSRGFPIHAASPWQMATDTSFPGYDAIAPRATFLEL